MSIYIHEISETAATVEVGSLWVSLELESKSQRVHDEDCERAYSYTEYTPSIKAVQGLDENDTPYSLSDEMVAQVKKSLDCDKFYNAYQSLFDEELKWGKSVAGWY